MLLLLTCQSVCITADRGGAGVGVGSFCLFWWVGMQCFWASILDAVVAGWLEALSAP